MYKLSADDTNRVAMERNRIFRKVQADFLVQQFLFHLVLDNCSGGSFSGAGRFRNHHQKPCVWLSFIYVSLNIGCNAAGMQINDPSVLKPNSGCFSRLTLQKRRCCYVTNIESAAKFVRVQSSNARVYFI